MTTNLLLQAARCRNCGDRTAALEVRSEELSAEAGKVQIVPLCFDCVNRCEQCEEFFLCDEFAVNADDTHPATCIPCQAEWDYDIIGLAYQRKLLVAWNTIRLKYPQPSKRPRRTLKAGAAKYLSTIIG
jgi:hypothetical protein